MREIIRQLLDDADRGKPVCYCRLVETRGSTPQKAGAAMLVYEDGSQAGTLGGGCVEAEVKRRALAVLARGNAQIAKFQLDSDYGWDDGLICGGRMQVLVQPMAAGAVHEYFRRLGRVAEDAVAATEAIDFEGQPGGLHPTASYLFDADARLIASLHEMASSDDGPPLVREHLK